MEYSRERWSPERADEWTIHELLASVLAVMSYTFDLWQLARSAFSKPICRIFG